MILKAKVKTLQLFIVSVSKSVGMLFVVGILALLSLGAWVLSSPVGSSPDDDFHMSSIWCASNGLSQMCEKSDSSDTRMVAKALIASHACFSLQINKSASCQTEAKVVTNLTLVETGIGNFAGGYPPVYYEFMHNFVSKDVIASVLAIRFINIVIFTIFALSLWLLAPVRLRAAQRFTWVICTVPLGLFIIASINPSSWAITGLGFSFLSLLALLIEKQNIARSLGLALIYVLASLMAAGARGDSAIYVCLASGLAAFVTFEGWHYRKKLLLLPLLVILLALYLFDYSGQSQVVSTGFGESARASSRSINAISLLAENIMRLPNLFTGVFGSWPLGWLDTEIPQTVWFLGTAVFVSVVALSWQGLSKIQMIAHSATLAIISAIPLYILQTSGLVVGEMLQPRYLLPLIVVFASLSLISFNSTDLVGSRFWRLFVYVAVVASEASSLYLNLARYIQGGLGGAGSAQGFNLNIGPSWWWNTSIQPMTVFLVGSVSFALLIFILINPLKKNIPASIHG